jgi:acetyl esterase/lipase
MSNPELPPVPTEAPPEVLAFNREIEAATRGLPGPWETDLVEWRRSFDPGVRSERAHDHIADTDLGPIGIRVIHPASTAQGVFVHIHGGGFVVGSNDQFDLLLERLADATSLTVASVNYRLAPEDPYPAGPDDCEAGTRWLIDNAADRLGSEVVAIGGESAGASLAVVTMIRLRDRHGLMPFRVALLPYGVYDHRLTPSARTLGERSLIIDAPLLRWFTEQYLNDVDPSDADVSPIFAGLTGLPPAIFVVGDLDPLLDDTLFMAARWKAAGNPTTLEVWPGAVHAWDHLDTDYARAARARMHRTLRDILE